MFLRWVDGKTQVADALIKLHGDGRFVVSCVPSSIHGVGRGTRDYGCQTSSKTRAGKGTESQVTIKVAGACGRNVDVCDHNDNRDLTLKPCSHPVVLPRHPAVSSQGQNLRDQCLPFCRCTLCCKASLLARLWYHSSQWRFLKPC